MDKNDLLVHKLKVHGSQLFNSTSMIRYNAKAREFKAEAVGRRPY